MKKPSLRQAAFYILPVVTSSPSRAPHPSGLDPVKTGTSDGHKPPASRQREIDHYLELLRSLPSVRAEKVAFLREAIKNKSYNVSARDIADKILSITPESARF